ncbi:MAG: glycosyltransferase family 39 protein [Candidatus Krumholzibacteria bacterium]|nr:glycosyltransferase family 39 protein [Candidatus Krumholzibacteria bacterium]
MSHGISKRERAPSAPRRYAAVALLSAVFALGLGLRLHYALACTALPSYSDMALYNALATQRGMPSEAPPGYPLLLRLIYAICGVRNYAAVFVVQSVLSALTILLIYFITKRVSNTRAALIAAGIAAIYPSFIAYNLTTMTETVSVLIVALLLAALTIPSSERARAILAVVVLTVGFLFRPVLLLCTPGVFLSVKRRILFLVSLALILGPVLSYDLIAGKNALRGARGFYLTYNPTTTKKHGSMKKTELGRNDLPAETYFEKALAFMKANKTRVVDIVYHKASILLSRETDQYVLAPIAGRNANAISLLFYAHLPVTILGAVGMARYLDPNTKRVALPALSYLLFVILISIFKVRYRLPAEPAMIIFAGITLARATSISLPRLRLSRLARLAAPPEPDDPRDAPGGIGPQGAGVSRWKRLIPEAAKRDWDIVCLLLLVSLALRFYFAFAAGAPEALEKLVKRGHLGPDVAPLYPLFLRGTFAVFGAADFRAVFAIQAVIVAAAIMLLYAAVSSVAGRKAGIVAGVLGVVLPDMLLAHVNISPVPFILLCTAALMAVAASHYSSSAKASLSGMLAGIGIMLAPAFAYIVPGALVVQRRWRLFLLVLIGTLLPFTAFNVLRHMKLEPVYTPSLYEVEIKEMLRGKSAWRAIGHVYDNAAVALSRKWGVERDEKLDLSTEMSTFVAGYGFVVVLYLGLIGLVRCWRSEHRSVFLPPLLYMLLLIVLSKLEYPDRAVFEVLLVAYAAILLGGSCGGRAK